MKRNKVYNSLLINRKQSIPRFTIVIKLFYYLSFKTTNPKQDKEHCLLLETNFFIIKRQRSLCSI